MPDRQTSHTPLCVVPNHSGSEAVWLGFDDPGVGHVSVAEIRPGCDEALAYGGAADIAARIVLAVNAHDLLCEQLSSAIGLLEILLASRPDDTAHEDLADMRAALVKAGA